ncbi:transketolase family protein [Candidatus Woesearchaeota archaeon]|nr:transketolase family protein [Candidatus Woesearchaeota archaeon]
MDLKACRDGYGEALVELGKENKNVVALTADLSPSVKMDDFKAKFPDRFFDVGIAEQNLVTVASGLAHLGKIPFASSFGAFCPGRCWEQIRTTIAYNEANVKIVSTHCGLDVGEDGATHQVLEDIALMRTLPNMIVIVPCDFEQTKKATKAISKIDNPCYMRMGRSKSFSLTNKNTPFKIGKSQLLKKGDDIAIIGCGPLLNEALDAAKMSSKSVRVINMHTIKPIDEEAIIKAAKECKKIITIEDHQIDGGLGSAVCEVLADKSRKKITRLGVNDQFGESANHDDLFQKYKLTSKDILKYLK